MTNDDRNRIDGRSGELGRGSDLVERLVPLADQGPEVPAEGADLIKAATRDLWRREVARRRLRRRLVWAGGGLAAAATLLLAVGLALWTPGTGPAVSVVATLAAVDGTLQVVGHDGGESALTEGDAGAELRSGSRIRTGEAARATLSLSGGQSLRLDRSSEVRLGPSLVVELERGALYVDSEDADEGTVEVRTALGVARDVGTQFEVRLREGLLTVRVREGTVVLTRDDAVLQIAEGTGVAIEPGQTPRALAVASFGPEWGWILEAAPDFEIEGRSALAFLGWVTRETGLELSFRSPEVEQFAGTTILHGTIDGLPPGQAAEVVLPGCGLEAVREGGRLVIARSGTMP